MKKSFYKLIYISFVFLFLMCAGGMVKNEIVSAASWTSQTEAPSLTDKDGYTVIQNEKQLAYLINSISASGKYRLGRNLNMSGYTWPGVQKTFSGTFDGAGFVIENISPEAKSVHGLFTSLSGATVRNLSLNNCSFKGYTSVGAIAGTTAGATVIEKIVLTDCKVEVAYSTSGAWPNVGGVVGYADGTTKLQNVYNIKVIDAYVKSTVNNTNSKDIYMGGIVGLTKNNVTVQYCLNEATISNTSKVSATNGLFAGGIAGYSYCAISNCGNTGAISGGNTAVNSSYVGGIVGYTPNSISNCYNRGNVTANAKENSSPSTSSYSKSMSHVTLSSSGYKQTVYEKMAKAGGIAGHVDGSISTVYSTGTASGGYKRIKIEVSVGNSSSSVSGGAPPSHYWSSYTQTTTTKTSSYDASITYDDVIYVSDINGNVAKTGTNVYGHKSYLTNNASYSAHERVTSSSVTETVYRSGSRSVTSSSSSVLSDASKASASSQAYTVSKSVSLTAPSGSKSYSGTKFSITIGASSASISFANTASWETGALWWKESHSETETMSLYSVSYSARKTNYAISSNLKTLQSGFSSSVWAVNSNINSGYPYLIKLYW